MRTDGPPESGSHSRASCSASEALHHAHGQGKAPPREDRQRRGRSPTRGQPLRLSTVNGLQRSVSIRKQNQLQPLALLGQHPKEEGPSVNGLDTSKANSFNSAVFNIQPTFLLQNGNCEDDSGGIDDVIIVDESSFRNTYKSYAAKGDSHADRIGRICDSPSGKGSGAVLDDAAAPPHRAHESPSNSYQVVRGRTLEVFEEPERVLQSSTGCDRRKRPDRAAKEEAAPEGSCRSYDSSSVYSAASQDDPRPGPLESFSQSYYSMSSLQYERRVPKSRSYADEGARRGRGARPLSEYASRRGAVRHRDAEEALSCLLWQPYECRGGPGGAGPGGPGGPGEGPERGAPAAPPGPSAAHSLPASRDGESPATAPAMRLTVPPPAQPAIGPPKEPTAGVSVNVNDTCISINSVNSAVQNCAVVDANSVSNVRVSGEVVGVRSWGAQTEEPPPRPHLPPPYSTLPHPSQPALLPLPPPPQQHAYPFQPVSLRRCQYGEESERPKSCCGAGGARALSLRWFIVLVALAGVCCVLVGTVLGAVRAQGRAHLTVLLLMIGVGLVLVTMSGVAWRALGRRRGAARAAAGAARRSAPACARAHHPYAAMLYPEFHCRPPPPSYQASMHEYRLRLLLLDRAASTPPVTCPPPAYRPRPRGMVSGGPPYMGGRGARGRRRQEPRAPPPSLSAVVIQNIALEPYDDIKYDDSPEIEQHIGSDRKEEEVQQEHKEGNLVTIVQTGEDTSPVIVTVSGSMPEERTNQTHTSEIDILAHL